MRADAAGGQLIGTPAVSGKLTGGSGPLQITQTTLQPTASSGVGIQLNLNSSATPVSGSGGINPTDPSSYNFTTTSSVYDSLGNSHLLTTYYQLTSGGPPPTWNVLWTVNGTTASGGITSGTTTLSFGEGGSISSGTSGFTAAGLTWADGASGSSITVSFNGSTDYSAPFAVNNVTNDGYGVGQLSNLSIDPSGIVFGRYSNGQSQILGQITLTNFKAPQGLQRVGNNYYVSTYQSGQPLTGSPQSAGLGSLQASAVEQSNVDLSTQLVNLIVAQQAYQANAQTIKTQNQVVQTLLTL
ncbi:flagellar hook protein FlgE [mine drainage metagenome]|uniref:Flagellar hook protein FlgE n=1 Tax=mine drainage metagenome TaxID=410659 RepID=A0A1J5PLG9_9ZZZZ